MPNVVQFILGGELGLGISAIDAGLGAAQPMSLFGSSASVRSDVEESPSAGESPDFTPSASSGNELNEGNPNTFSMNLDTEP